MCAAVVSQHRLSGSRHHVATSRPTTAEASSTTARAASSPSQASIAPARTPASPARTTAGPVTTPPRRRSADSCPDGAPSSMTSRARSSLRLPGPGGRRLHLLLDDRHLDLAVRVDPLRHALGVDGGLGSHPEVLHPPHPRAGALRLVVP